MDDVAGHGGAGHADRPGGGRSDRPVSGADSGAGNDLVYVGDGTNTANGDAGRDTLIGHTGIDTLNTVPNGNLFSITVAPLMLPENFGVGVGAGVRIDIALTSVILKEAMPEA